MTLLLAFAFLAGIITVLSPCILPILPIILSSSIGGHPSGYSRPIGVVTGFIASFTFFTLFLTTIVRALGIPADTLRVVSIIVIASFGISLLIPAFQLFVERLFSRLASFMPAGQNRTGFGGGLLIGLSVGLLWTPCVGPILASVISLALTGTVTLDAFLITLSYALGTAIPMFLIILGGQNALRRVPFLLRNLANIQKGFGVIMVLTAIAIFFNFDRTFQTIILKSFPQYGAGLTKIEDNTLVKKELEKKSSKTNEKDMGKPMFDLLEDKGVQAPELIQGGEWYNSKPLKLSDLKGKVVIVDFWTYSCINCQRTLPYLKDWYKKYKDKGLVIIGVHSPEFEFEKNKDNVAKALKDFDITYPVMQDNDFATWRSYSNQYWPAKYFIDKDGYVRYTHFGEGEYDQSEKVIQELLAETGAKVSGPINNPTYKVDANTPESYLGYGRMNNLASPEQIVPDKISVYTKPDDLGQNLLAFKGSWNVMNEYANPQKGAQLYFNFDAKDVYLVMKPIKGEAKVSIYVDGKKQFFGDDNINGEVTVTHDTLYKIVHIDTRGKHILILRFEDSNAQLFAFTFG